MGTWKKSLFSLECILKIDRERNTEIKAISDK